MSATIKYALLSASTVLLLFSCKSQETLILQDSTIGCGNFHAFILTQEGNQYIHLAKQSVELKSGDNHFDLSEENLLVEYARFDGDISKMICNDIRMNDSPKELERFKSISGSCIVTLTEENFKLYQQGNPYEIGFALITVKFENGIEVQYQGTAIVGWMPG